MALRNGKLAERARRPRCAPACDAWILTRAGRVRTRGGDLFKPARSAPTTRRSGSACIPTLADAPFYRVRRVHCRTWSTSSSARAWLRRRSATRRPLRAIYPRAVPRDELDVSPTTGVKIPAVRNGRDRFATPDEAAAAARGLPARDRALWATAMYAGLRRGELMALRWTDVDLKAGAIDVVASGTSATGRRPKSRNRRRVPIAAALREYLAAERLASRTASICASGSRRRRPFRAGLACRSEPTRHGRPPSWSESRCTSAATRSRA